MTFEEFITGLADVEGKAALERYGYDWWQQATEEERAKLIMAIDQLTGPVRKMVKSFWACCGVYIETNWVTVGGKSYAISPELVGRKDAHLELERMVAFPEKVVVKNISEPYGKSYNKKV